SEQRPHAISYEFEGPSAIGRGPITVCSGAWAPRPQLARCAIASPQAIGSAEPGTDQVTNLVWPMCGRRRRMTSLWGIAAAKASSSAWLRHAESVQKVFLVGCASNE